MNDKKMLGNLLLLLTAMIWGTAFVFQRVGMDSIEPITFNAARMALAAVMVGALAFGLRQRKNKNVFPDGTAGLSAPAAATAGKAGFITAMYMLLVPILNLLLFKKKSSWLVWLAVFFGVAGMYLLCVKEDFSLTRGDMLVCICALMFSGHILCCDYFVKRANPIELAAIQFATAAVVSAGIASFTESPNWAGIAAATVPILYCGVVSGGIGYTLQIVAQKFTDPTVASLLMSLESVFAVIAGAVLLGEQMSSRELLGCVVLFAATILVQIPLPERGKT